jgi:hypothetical protein
MMFSPKTEYRKMLTMSFSRQKGEKVRSIFNKSRNHEEHQENQRKPKKTQNVVPLCALCGEFGSFEKCSAWI